MRHSFVTDPPRLKQGAGAARRATSLGFSEELFRRRLKEEYSEEEVALALLDALSLPRRQWRRSEAPGAAAAPRAAGDTPVALLVLSVLGVGCAAEASSEWLMSRDPGCGNLMILCDYASSLALAGPSSLRGRAGGAWSVPVGYHAVLAAAGAGYGQLMNLVYGTPLPMSVILVLKNGILVANLFVGSLMGQRFSSEQVLAVLTVTGGLVATALAAQPAKAKPSAAAAQVGRRMAGGFAMMLGALSVRALSNALQEVTMHRCRNRSALIAESLFFRSCVGAPLEFLTARPAIARHWSRWNQQQLCGLRWPGVWLVLCAHLGLNYAMKTLVSRLVGRTSALSANITLTFQRFLSFVVSSLVLNPSPGGSKPALWLGSLAVLGGAVAYAPASQRAALRAAEWDEAAVAKGAESDAGQA